MFIFVLSANRRIFIVCVFFFSSSYLFIYSTILFLCALSNNIIKYIVAISLVLPGKKWLSHTIPYHHTNHIVCTIEAYAKSSHTIEIGTSQERVNSHTTSHQNGNSNNNNTYKKSRTTKIMLLRISFLSALASLSAEWMNKFDMKLSVIGSNDRRRQVAKRRDEK